MLTRPTAISALKVSLNFVAASKVYSRCTLRQGFSMAASSPCDHPRFIDIGVNLTDPIFRGSYHGKQTHPDDLDRVLGRARAAGVVAQIITGGSLSESKEALELCASGDDLFATVGCHPTRSAEFDNHADGPAAYKQALVELLEKHAVTRAKGNGKVVAVGECGLDYDRLHFASVETQKKYFAIQLELAESFGLPLFLHSRAAADDFLQILEPWLDRLSSALCTDKGDRPLPSLPEELRRDHGSASPPRRIGVVHSFTGTFCEVKRLIERGLFIGVNGCSLKTDENLQVIKSIPLDRLLLETDAPWCNLRPTHAGTKLLSQHACLTQSPLAALYLPPSVKKEKHDPDKTVKGRNEPCAIGAVASIVAALKGLDVEVVAEVIECNTRWLFDF